MDEQELMALPEITDLSYVITEGRSEDGPHDYYRQRTIGVRTYPSGKREVGMRAFGYGLEFQGRFRDAIGIVFNTFLDFHDWERGLPAQNLSCCNYDPSLIKFGQYWVLTQQTEGLPWDEQAPVARIHNDLVQVTLRQIYADYLRLPPVPPSQVAPPQQ